MVAPVAIQQGTAAAGNILRLIQGKALADFSYQDPGTMVTIGRNSAIVKIGKLGFAGFIAWVLWLVLHLYKLIGFRNRLIVLINWGLDYFFVDRAIRIILPSLRQKDRFSKGSPPDEQGRDHHQGG
jgi:NADH dehydrogenase